ncbi:MAG: FHA domain-containing protein [Myxococcaceae bacterium]|nr:FHA domain-containing protein [Myxococcaceae bacterium]
MPVPFTLKVSKGAGTGAEFPFDTTEARLGRTADNDIVVKDSGASRAHARVFAKGKRYFVEDLKSANGTKVNDALINAAREIKHGDTITIGDVEFTFTLADETMMRPPSGDGNFADQTMLKPAPSFDETGERTGENPALGTAETPAFDPNATDLRPPLKPKDVDPERERRTTPRRPSISNDETMLPKNARAAVANDETMLPKNAKASVANDETMLPSRALAKKPAEEAMAPADSHTAEMQVPPALVRRGGGQANDDGDADELTAADKLRMRRQAQKTVGGRLAYMWGELKTPAKIVIGGISGVFALGLVALVVIAAWPATKKSVGPEPNEISGGGQTIQASFGLGEGVTFERPDMKIFQFTAASPTRIVGVVHYMAKDISKDEVAVTVNGFDLGFVPPDTLDTANRELEVVIPAQQVKKNELNNLTFDNTRNPPGEDPWRVWNLWIELIAIPDMSQEELITEVKEDFRRSEKFYDERDIGPDSLFKAWKGYRDAWLKMESMTQRPDELYIVARQQQREMAVLLDKRCSMMLLAYQQAMSQKKADRKRGRQIAEDMLRYFPTREHRCHSLARELIEEVGGL